MWIVIGASGFFGSYFLKNIKELSDEAVTAVARSHALANVGDVDWIFADIAQEAGVEKIREASLRGKHNKVIFLAACHKPDEVAANPRLAWDVNITALSRVMNALENVECFFYSSTDSVYGESIGGYHFKEGDACHPKNEYGRQKMTAEVLVTGYGHHVARFPFLIGKSLASHKMHFYDQILDTIADGKPMEMFSDSYRSALDFDAASRILIEIMEHHATECPSILNICGDDDLSKYDIGKMMAREFGYSEDLIIPISVKRNSEIFKTPRAESTLMDNGALKHLIGVDRIKINISDRQ